MFFKKKVKIKKMKKLVKKTETSHLFAVTIAKI